MLLNESFKKLYGFGKKTNEEPYFARLKKLAAIFPQFNSEIHVLEAELHEYSIKDSWWKDERDAEVHLDIEKLHQYRHEEVDESKVVLETLPLIDIFNEMNVLLEILHKVFIAYLNTNE